MNPSAAVVNSCDDGPGPTALPPEPQPFTVSGKVTYCGRDCLPIEGVVLTLQSADTTLTTATDATGAYGVQSVPRGEYSLAATRAQTDDDSEAIGTFDALFVGWHAMGAIPLTDACQLQAADVDGDGEVTEADFDAIAGFITLMPQPDVGQWRFSESISGISSDATVDFTGLLLGDVNVSWPHLNWEPCPGPPVPDPPIG